MQLSQLCRIRPGDSLPGWRTHVPHLLCVWWMCVCMGVRVHVDTGGEHGCPPRWLEVRSDLTEFMFQPHCLVSQPLGTTYSASPPTPAPPSALRVRTHITIANFLIRCWGSKSDHLPVQQTLTKPVPQPPSSPPALYLPAFETVLFYSPGWPRTVWGQAGSELTATLPQWSECRDYRCEASNNLMGAVALDKKLLLSQGLSFPIFEMGESNSTSC